MTVATVGDLPALGALRSPDRAALKERESGRTRTYAELDERTSRLANALLGLGLEPGDRVAAWMEDCLEYVELYLAAAKAGLALVPINARFKVGEATHHLTDSGARALAWTPGLAERVEELGADLVELAPERFEALLAAGDARRPPAPDPDDLYIVGYTSGTTGTPKGALLTHRSVLAIARLNSQSYRLPIHGVGALTGSMSFVATVPAHVVTHLYTGGTCVLMGDWDVESLIDTVARERATFTYVPSPLISDFAAAASARPRDWATLESILHSASRAAPEKLRELCEVVGGRFVEGLGMTESSGGLVTATTRADVEGAASSARDVFESAGRAAVECVLDLVGPEGERLPHDGDAIGELIVRSPALMSGYWGLPEATAAALRDGWYHTGDLGSIDPAGYVYVTERRNDLVVSGGMNVYPSEVERCIAALPGVVDCGVVGAPHERWGQTVVAFVVAAPGADLDEARVVEHCRRQLASYKKPTAVAFVDALPRTTNLKLDRVALRDRAASRWPHRPPASGAARR